MKKQFLISLILVSLVLTISAQQIPVAGDGYHFYGPNTSWGQYLQVGGNGRVTTNASVFASNGNLHIDSKDGFGIYLNYFGFGNTYINPRGGVIGVGTDAPDPNCGMHMYQNRYTLYGPNTTWGQYLQVGGNGRVTTNASVVATNGNLHIDSKDGFGTYLNYYSLGNTYINSNGGNVGIGTTSPQALFQVGGGITPGTAEANGRGFIQINSSGGLENMSGLEFKTSAYSAGYGWKIVSPDLSNGSTPLIFGSRSGSTNWEERIRIDNLSGNIGIGTTSPQNKLDVNGTIHAKEVKVDLIGWSDFVFAPNYKLQPLTYVEQYIKTNGHLPEIPSAKEVEQNGVNVGDMQAKLLQKVEELTLYSIEMEKAKVKVEAKVEDMQQQLAAQAKEIEALKQLINQKLKQ